MTPLRILKLRIQGFRSFDAMQEFNLADYSPGFYFVKGENRESPELGANGAGKSTIWESLCWGLFGKTSRNLKAGNVKNWAGTHSCKVEILVSMLGEEHLIVRTWKPNSLTWDGVELEQEALEHKLQINFDSFRFSIFVAQFDARFFEYRPAEKLKIFMSFLEEELSTWKELEGKVSERRETVSQRLNACESSLEISQGLLSREDEREQAIIQKRENFEYERNTELQQLDTEILILEQSLIDLEKQLRTSIERTAAVENEREALGVSLQESRNVFAPKYQEFQIKTAAFFKDEAKLDALKDNLEKMDLLRGEGICLHCFQELPDKYVEKTAAELLGQIEPLEAALIEEKGRLEAEQTVLQKLERDIRNGEMQHDSLHVQLQHIKKEIQSQKSAEKELQERVSRVKAKRDSKSKAQNPFEDLIQSSNKRTEELEEQIDLLQADKLSMLKDLAVWDYFHKTGLKKIKLSIISSALDSLSTSINKYIKRLGLSDWSVSLEVDRETKTGVIKSDLVTLVSSPGNDKLVPLECYCGGENGRLLLAGTLGLMDFIQERGFDWGLEIWDEPTQWLSAEGITGLLEVLKERAYDYSKRIFIVDHRNFEALGIFDGDVTVVKDFTGSKII